MKNFLDFSVLDAMKNHPVSGQIDQLFRSVIKEQKVSQPEESFTEEPAEHNDQELSLDDAGEFDLNLGGDENPPQDFPQDDGFELSLDSDESLDLAEDTGEELSNQEDNYGDLSLSEDGVDELSLSSFDEGEEEVSEGIENLGELSFPDTPDEDLSLSGDDAGDLSLSLGGDDSLELNSDGLDLVGDEDLSLSDDSASEELSLGDGEELSLGAEEESSGDLSLNFTSEDALTLSDEEADLSDDAKEKLKEIDAIMDLDASQINIHANLGQMDENLDEPLVSPDLNLESLNFSTEDTEEEIVPVKEEKPKKKKKETVEAKESRDREYGEDLKEISGAYSGEMERMQATISNLRADREELLQKIQKMEDDKLMQSRQTLSIRAELDERKIELTIIRKKLNEEINELKDRLKLFDEKKLILEEKNRILHQELDKAAQKNKIDVKKVQMRERELEGKLELLKADAETQIRNRDLKILELKRKIDAMEFDMESISQQEKRSVESRYELEDKLDKAIKTLRGAITVLEDESDRSNALSALKKNIDM